MPDSSDDRISPPPRKPPEPARRMPTALLKWTLAGLPELDLFETDEQRERALSDFGREAGSPRRWDWWVGITIVIVTVVAATISMRYLRRYLPLPRLAQDLVQIIVQLGLSLLVVRWLHRSGASRTLRQSLLDAGIPVCLHCGYCLRGQPDGSNRCPECGQSIAGAAAVLLEKARNPAPSTVGSIEASADPQSVH